MASYYQKIREIKKKVNKLTAQIAHKENLDSLHELKCTSEEWNGIVDRLSYALGLQISTNNKTVSDFEISDTLSFERIQEPILTIMDSLCDKNFGEKCSCAESCLVNAILIKDGKAYIDYEKCIHCGLCVTSCPQGAISEKTEIVHVINLIKENPQKVIAILAPAFVGQFGNEATPEKLKTVLKKFGFAEVLEVALAADIITFKEAMEFKERMEHGDNFMITSCCCPAFVKLVERYKGKIAHLISESVSPMVGLARLIKIQNPNFKVVFIGPCLAKKSEALKPEYKEDVDAVLTFEELNPMLEAINIYWDEIEGITMEDASHDGRIYARTSGVSEAITRGVEQLFPHLQVKAVHGDGLGDCIKLLKQLEGNELDANFMEGMACPGGCIGGPGTILEEAQAREIINSYAKNAHCFKAIDNEKASYLAQSFGSFVDLQSHKSKDSLIHT